MCHTMCHTYASNYSCVLVRHRTPRPWFHTSAEWGRSIRWSAGINCCSSRKRKPPEILVLSAFWVGCCVLCSKNCSKQWSWYINLLLLARVLLHRCIYTPFSVLWTVSRLLQRLFTNNLFINLSILIRWFLGHFYETQHTKGFIL